METRLTARQQTFVNLFALGTYKAAQAWTMAGFSAKTADQAASRALSTVKIKDAIASKRRELEIAGKVLNVTPEWITRRLAEEATGDAKDTTPAARVSALRTLADIQGLLSGGKQDLPDSVLALMQGFAAGFEQRRLAGSPQPVAIEARLVEELEEP